jgi:hypothetical protein
VGCRFKQEAKRGLRFGFPGAGSGTGTYCRAHLRLCAKEREKGKQDKDSPPRHETSHLRRFCFASVRFFDCNCQ